MRPAATAIIEVRNALLLIPIATLLACSLFIPSLLRTGGGGLDEFGFDDESHVIACDCLRIRPPARLAGKVVAVSSLEIDLQHFPNV
jgi:hypothetical protein